MSDEKRNEPGGTPREHDTAADHVEKKPQEKQSPQQTHDDQDHG